MDMIDQRNQIRQLQRELSDVKRQVAHVPVRMPLVGGAPAVSIIPGVVKKCIAASCINDCLVAGSVEVWPLVTVPAWTPLTAYAQGDRRQWIPKPWQTSTAYSEGDRVSVDAAAWQTSTAYSEGDRVRVDAAAWQTSTAYVVGEEVLEVGVRYKCLTAHTSDVAVFQNDIANWTQLVGTGKYYRANTDHTSDLAVFQNDIANWDEVEHPHRHYRANTNHTSSGSDFQTDIANWDEVLDPYQHFQAITNFTSTATFDYANWIALDCAGRWFDRTGPVNTYSWPFTFVLPQGARYDSHGSDTQNATCSAMVGF